MPTTPAFTFLMSGKLCNRLSGFILTLVTNGPRSPRVLGVLLLSSTPCSHFPFLTDIYTCSDAIRRIGRWESNSHPPLTFWRYAWLCGLNFLMKSAYLQNVSTRSTSVAVCSSYFFSGSLDMVMPTGRGTGEDPLGKCSLSAPLSDVKTGREN